MRPDGREMEEGRDIIISDGTFFLLSWSLAHITTADGSCFVRLGETAVICGLKLEVENQKEANVTQGSLGIFYIFLGIFKKWIML